MRFNFIAFILIMSFCTGNYGSKPNQIDSVVNNSTKNTKSDFGSFWNDFKLILKRKNINALKYNSLKNIEVGDKSVNIDTFVKSYSELFDEKLLNLFSDKSKIEFINSEIEVGSLLSEELKGLTELKTVEVNITKSDKYPDQIIVILKFVQTKTGYKFYGYNSVGEKIELKKK